MPDPIRVLIVDDSRLFRTALESALGGQPDIKVVGSVFSGAKAIEFLRDRLAARANNDPRSEVPDVVTLDVEMSGMDGLETLGQLQQLMTSGRAAAAIAVIMVSAFTRRGADVTVRALQAGALDFVAKPSGPDAQANMVALRDDLLPKIRACVRRQRGTAIGLASAAPAALPPIIAGPRRAGVRAIVIGASTGGPRALCTLMPELCARMQLPILVVQHMPPNFTRSLAESLARQARCRVVEASEGMPIEQACAYIAPGGRHLVVRGPAAAPLIGINDLPAENGCRPAADVLFRSAATVWRSDLIAIILTGMGRDGTAGLGAVRRAGGYVVAQDEASSVVWGMPGSAVEAKVVDQVLPLDRIAQHVADMVARGAAG